MARALRVWLLAVRFPSLTASVIPVLVGTAVVAHDAFRPGLFAMALIGSMALQAGTNLVNDYYDHMQGADSGESLGPSGVIQLGLLSPRAVLIGGLVAFAIGAALGIVIAAIAGWALLPLGVASVLAGYAYTAPPLKLAYRGLGEVTSFAFMGPVIVMGAAYVQVEAFTWEAFLASLPVGFLVATILHANNLRDIDDDRTHAKYTLASLVGRPAADYELIALIALAFAGAASLAGAGIVSRYGLIALLAAPLALRTATALRVSRNPRSLNRVLLSTVGLHLVFGLLWALGLAIGAWTD